METPYYLGIIVKINYLNHKIDHRISCFAHLNHCNLDLCQQQSKQAVQCLSNS